PALSRRSAWRRSGRAENRSTGSAACCGRFRVLVRRESAYRSRWRSSQKTSDSGTYSLLVEQGRLFSAQPTAEDARVDCRSDPRFAPVRSPPVEKSSETGGEAVRSGWRGRQSRLQKPWMRSATSSGCSTIGRCAESGTVADCAPSTRSARDDIASGENPG